MNKHVGDSVFKIAPEREKEFGNALTGFDLIYSNERPWKFCADPKTQEIFVSRGAVELIWCASLGHLLFYEKLIQGKRFDKPTQIDPQSEPEVHIALELLRWSLNCQLAKNTSDDWPPHLPHPLEAPAKETNENLADEMCLVSCAFLLHHELAHIRNKHIAGESEDWSLSQEKEADIAAAEWILDGVNPADKKFVKRMLGIVQAFLITTTFGLIRGTLGGKTHPFSYDRLTAILDRFRCPHSHDIKAFAFAVLDLYFQNSGRKMKKTTFDDFDEALEAICDELAQEFQAKKEPHAHN